MKSPGWHPQLLFVVVDAGNSYASIESEQDSLQQIMELKCFFHTMKQVKPG